MYRSGREAVESVAPVDLMISSSGRRARKKSTFLVYRGERVKLVQSGGMIVPSCILYLLPRVEV